MRLVEVPLGAQSYEIRIGPGLLDGLGEAARRAGEGAAVISDVNVWALYGPALTDTLAAAELDFTPIVIPAGEESKSMAQLERVYAAFAEAGLGRKGLVLAFGGGVVGDLAGYAAATWMRGVDYIQIPSTLLAQVDSSVGGKTAVNLPAGKNLVGAFYQPRLVLADTALLDSLPERELRCGVAEMVKYGAIFDPALFAALSQPLDFGQLPEMIETCCRLKSATVQADERDVGQRMLLNFGHSFGHAMESLGGYSRFNHGEAVAMGMALAADFGEKTGFTLPGCGERIRRALLTQGLPIECPYSAAELLSVMGMDKKGRDGGLDLILLKEIGRAEIHWHSLAEIQSVLEEVL